jgi:8-oxo-dGTP pyrophosphatase MutT (NUDIX family)
MKPGKIRPIAICVFQNQEKILVFEGYDSVKEEIFYRPLGGSIEFGEYSRETARREIGEEIGAEVSELTYLGTIENIFTYNGEAGHEIVFVYRGEFKDRSLYNSSQITGTEDGDPIKVMWKSLNDFRNGQLPLYPTGLLELLTRRESEYSK